jgi:hypothetical protein
MCIQCKKILSDYRFAYCTRVLYIDRIEEASVIHPHCKSCHLKYSCSSVEQSGVNKLILHYPLDIFLHIENQNKNMRKTSFPNGIYLGK